MAHWAFLRHSVLDRGLKIVRAQTIPLLIELEAQVGPDPGANLWNYMQADVSFGLSGQTVAFVSGGVDIHNPAHNVPEPSTVLLLASGLADLGGWRWRQARPSKPS